MYSPDLNSLSLNEATQLHLLRHFSSLDERYAENLTSAHGIQGQKIKDQMNMSGGKFFTGFASNPIELWERLKKVIVETPVSVSWDGDHGYCRVLFDEEQFPDGIGVDGIIKLKELDEKDKKFLRREQRDGIEIIFFDLPSKRKTWQVNVALMKTDKGISLTTIFPGTFAPPFPNRKHQNEDAYSKNLEFWKYCALVK